MLKTVGIDLTLKNCGRLDELEVEAIKNVRVVMLVFVAYVTRRCGHNFLRMAAHHLKPLLLKGFIF
jgi:hypothetical protein